MTSFDTFKTCFTGYHKIDSRHGHRVWAVGGSLALDFVNTVDWRDDPARRIDLIPTAATLAAWAKHAGFPAAARACRPPGRHHRAVGLRETLAALFGAATNARRLPAAALAELTHWNQDAWRQRVLTSRQKTAAWRWRARTNGADRLLFTIALDAADLLLSAERSRLRVCEGAGCGCCSSSIAARPAGGAGATWRCAATASRCGRIARGCPMTDPGKPVVLTRAGCIKGAREILPLCTFVFVLAATFGVAARQAGLSISLASLMSAAVFAGGAQFAALALLGPPPSIMPILLGTLAINARHLLLGAALAPWLLQLPRWQRLCAVTVLSDANWAQAMRAYAAGERDAGVLVGAGVTMWITWVIGTATGALASMAVPDVSRFGLDALLVGFFAAALTGGWRGKPDAPAAIGAAVVTLAMMALGARDWSILIGAVGGAAAGAWSDAHTR